MSPDVYAIPTACTHTHTLTHPSPLFLLCCAIAIMLDGNAILLDHNAIMLGENAIMLGGNAIVPADNAILLAGMVDKLHPLKFVR